MPTNRLVVKEQIATYVQVLFDAANKAGGQDAVLEVRDQASKIVSVMNGSSDLQAALNDPSYSPEQRNTIVRGVFSDVNPVLTDVIAVMAERGEIEYLPRVWKEFDALVTKKLNLTVVEVITAVELDDHLRDIITKKAAAELGTDVVLDERVDKSIIGGIIMRANGEIIDASVSTKVEAARQTLKQS